LNYSGSGTIDLWFTISVVGVDVILVVGAGVTTYVLDIFLFGCSIDGASLNLLSSSLSFILSASDSVSCMSCSLDSSWYSDYSSLM